MVVRGGRGKKEEWIAKWIDRWRIRWVSKKRWINEWKNGIWGSEE